MADYLNESEADRLSRLVRYFESAEEASQDSRKDAEKARDYYDGKQWTAEEVAILNQRKQPVITINRIKPKVNFLIGLEAQQRTLPKAHPRTPKHEQDAEAAGDALRYVVEDQNFDVVGSEAFEHLSIEGIAGADVSVRDTANGQRQITIKLIPWDRIFFDPHSRKRNFSDAKYKGQVLWMDYEDAAAEFPGKEAILASTLSTESSPSDTHADVPRIRWADVKRKRIRIVEIWHQEGGIWHHCIYTKGGILVQEESPFVNEDGESVDGFVFGSAFVDRDGNRYGIVKDWIPIQDEINKRRSKAQHLMSVRQTWGNQQAGDKNKFRTELAKPDGHVEVTAGAKFGEDFGVLPTGDMAQAQFNLLQEAKSEIDAVGVNAALSGTDGRSMSGRALIARQESGMSELGPLFDAYKQWKLDVYRAVWLRIRQYWTEEKWIRVTDDEKNTRFVGLNQPITLGQQLLEEARAQGVEITPDMEFQAKNDPQMQQQVGVRNNIAELDVDIMLDDVPASASLQAEQFETLAGLAKNGLQIPPKAIIKASSLRNKEEILKEMQGGSEISPQLQQQMQQMQETLQQMAQALQDKQAEQSIKEREVGVKEYEAETERMTAVAPVMGPEQIQAIVMQTIQDLMSQQAQEVPAEMPMEPDPPIEQPIEPEAADAAFFTSEQPQEFPPA